jgi:arabinogalactan oligomer/maltooligosaccharide transport system permease protein
MPNEPPRVAFTPRLISFFSGTAGFAMKIALLSLSNALAVWAAYVLIDRRQWIPVVILAAATAAIDLLYFGRRTLPLKFLIPGTLFMLAFQIIPILYTIDVAFTNYSTGHITSKQDAITQIQLTSLQPPADAKQYTMAPARDKDGHLVLILQDQVSGADFVGTE